MNNQNPSNGASGGQGQNPWGIPGGDSGQFQWRLRRWLRQSFGTAVGSEPEQQPVQWWHQRPLGDCRVARLLPSPLRLQLLQLHHGEVRSGNLPAKHRPGRNRLHRCPSCRCWWDLLRAAIVAPRPSFSSSSCSLAGFRHCCTLSLCVLSWKCSSQLFAPRRTPRHCAKHRQVSNHVTGSGCARRPGCTGTMVRFSELSHQEMPSQSERNRQAPTSEPAVKPQKRRGESQATPTPFAWWIYFTTADFLIQKRPWSSL